MTYGLRILQSALTTSFYVELTLNRGTGRRIGTPPSRDICDFFFLLRFVILTGLLHVPLRLLKVSTVRLPFPSRSRSTATRSITSANHHLSSFLSRTLSGTLDKLLPKIKTPWTPLIRDLTSQDRDSQSKTRSGCHNFQQDW